VRFIADDERLTLSRNKKIAKAFLDAGAVIPKAVPPAGGSGWESTMLEVNDLQDKVAPSLGSIAAHSDAVRASGGAHLQAGALRTREDWCAIVAATPKEAQFRVRQKSNGTPIYDVNLVYLLASKATGHITSP